MFDEISHISIRDVKNHYLLRKAIHSELIILLQARQIDKYVQLALGISNAHGNYSAAEHNHGPKILYENINAPKRVFELGERLLSCKDVREIPSIIYKANISNLKISVGSEMALILQPNKFWVGNVRTIGPIF